MPVLCLADVPPLPPAPSNYTWMYDSNFNIRSYSFSNLDYVRTPDLLLAAMLLCMHGFVGGSTADTFTCVTPAC